MRRLRLLHVGVLVFALCLTLMLLRSYHPIYDGHPNNGDETMSLAQAMNSFRLRSPSYGYTAQTTPWTAGLFTLPGYFLVYGPLMLAVPPLQRLGAARACSRVLMAAALFACLLLLWRALQSRQRRTRADAIGVALLAAGLVWLFSVSETFLYVASFARVDALAVLCVCAFHGVAGSFLAEPTERRLIVLGLMVFVTGSCSHLAGALCAVDAVVLGLWHLTRSFDRRRLISVLRAVGIVGAISASVFVLINFVLLRSTAGSTTNVAMRGELSNIAWRATHLGSLAIRPLLHDLPGLVTAVVFVGGGSLLLLAGSARRRVPLLLLRLGATLVVAWVVFVVERGVYAPFLVVAVLLPFLDQLVRHAEPVGVRLVVMASFPLLVIFSMAGPPPDAAADAERARMNAYRDAHVRATIDFLDHEQAGAAIVTDPMFTLLESSHRSYAFIYEVHASPADERRVIARFLDRLGARHLVTTPFGESGWVRSIGVPRLDQATREHPSGFDPFDVAYPGGGGFRLQRRFVSSAPAPEPGHEYQYGDRPSTPITVFRIDALP